MFLRCRLNDGRGFFDAVQYYSMPVERRSEFLRCRAILLDGGLAMGQNGLHIGQIIRGLAMGRIWPMHGPNSPRPMHGQNSAYAWAEFGLCMGRIRPMHGPNHKRPSHGLNMAYARAKSSAA